MKKLLAIMIAASMALSLAACGSSAPSGSGDGSGEAPATGGKIAIITGTVSQGEEEFRAAENMKAKYGDMILTATYPDNFTKEQETTISNVENLVSQEGVEALIICQAVPGSSAAIAKAREINPDILVIAGVTGEDPAMIAAQADIVLNADELGMGVAMMEQAQKMGAKTFVHYSFPRHMGIALLSGRRDLLKETAAKLGITFVEATAPDPTSEAGVPGAQQFINEDVPKMIEKYGKDTAFFSTNCAMQEPLIRQVIEGGALLPQQCCPSPYHAYPGALGIAIPEDKAGDVTFITEEITKKIAESGSSGRVGTWPVPINMLFVEAGVEYARGYIDGTIKDKVDMAAVERICTEIAGEGMVVEKLTEAGKTYDNFFTILAPYIVF